MSPRQTALEYFIPPSRGPLFFRSEMSHYCTVVHTRWDQGCPLIPTFAWHVPACASNRVGSIPVSTLAHHLCPRALPLSTLPCIQNKNSCRPSCGPFLCSQPVIIDTFVFPASPAEQRHLSSQAYLSTFFSISPRCPGHIRSPTSLPLFSSHTAELQGIYIYTYNYIYIHTQTPFKLLVGPHVASLPHRPLHIYETSLLYLAGSPRPAVTTSICRPSVQKKITKEAHTSNMRVQATTFAAAVLPALVAAVEAPTLNGLNLIWSDSFAGNAGDAVDTSKWDIAQGGLNFSLAWLQTRTACFCGSFKSDT